MKIIIKKAILCGLSDGHVDDKWVQRAIELPFAPSEGMELKLDEGIYVSVRTLMWIHKEKYFLLFDMAHKELQRAAKDSTDPKNFRNENRLKEIVAEYIRNGWEESKEK